MVDPGEVTFVSSRCTGRKINYNKDGQVVAYYGHENWVKETIPRGHHYTKSDPSCKQLVMV